VQLKIFTNIVHGTLSNASSIGSQKCDPLGLPSGSATSCCSISAIDESFELLGAVPAFNVTRRCEVHHFKPISLSRTGIRLREQRSCSPMSNGINTFRIDRWFMFVAIRNDGASVEFLVCNGRA
jgi:hypothetical protein